ncbi:hypothetical protein JH146_0788 [Methanocaldococcus bathoardescens]|uniref:HEPN domain-containing protein n=1 Tax=Methanocaldococcus bathoardescens TaxID=1301915 RepID=A0A076LJA4_9EURY|nr:hypothetical protein [Methanocaldococcus bathoardescens]AIJ05634.1 hypothetical protein JH146_0788 [Methanocaldococcus bathoardescens]
MKTPTSKSNFNPEEFKNLAMYLKENKDNIHNPNEISIECINRVIAGRLYYSAFLILRETIIRELSNYSNCPKEVNYFKDALLGGSVHNTLLKFIEKIRDNNNLNQNPELREAISQIYNSLDCLKGHRVAADYDLSIPTPVKIKTNSNHKTVKTNRDYEEINFEKTRVIKKLERKYNLIIESLSKLEGILRKNKNDVCKILRELWVKK